MSSFMPFDTTTPNENLFTDCSNNKLRHQLIDCIWFKQPSMEPHISVRIIIQEVMSSLTDPQGSWMRQGDPQRNRSCVTRKGDGKKSTDISQMLTGARVCDGHCLYIISHGPQRCIHDRYDCYYYPYFPIQEPEAKWDQETCKVTHKQHNWHFAFMSPLFCSPDFKILFY